MWLLLTSITWDITTEFIVLEGSAASKEKRQVAIREVITLERKR